MSSRPPAAWFVPARHRARAGEGAPTSQQVSTQHSATTALTAWRAFLSREEGSGTVYAVGIIGALLALFVLIAALIQAQSAAGRARLGADLAALAGATAANSTFLPGDACAVATTVALANDTSLVSCEMVGEDVIVSVAAPARILGVPRQATASARAGPVYQTGVEE